uniref:Rhodanese domain-containing protein n=1 Tax=Zonotrichia albicollis TaxID=44394 RepID=A0A8D2MI20_ZONAL
MCLRVLSKHCLNSGGSGAMTTSLRRLNAAKKLLACNEAELFLQRGRSLVNHEQYNQKMPSKSDPVVFSCLAGTRSKQALGFAMSLGFSRAQHYGGGFDDWVKHEPPEKK